MEYFDFDVLLPRFLFVFLGWLIYSAFLLRRQKNDVDELNNASKRRQAWKTFWRKHWEDFPFALIVSLITSIVIDVGVILYDAWSKTDYHETISNAAGADLGVSFLLGAFGMQLISKYYSKGKNKIDES